MAEHPHSHRYPQGAAEVEKFVGRLRNELGRFDRQEAPYTPADNPDRMAIVTVLMSDADLTRLGLGRAPNYPYVAVTEVEDSTGGESDFVLTCSQGRRGCDDVRPVIEGSERTPQIATAIAHAHVHLAAHLKQSEV